MTLEEFQEWKKHPASERFFKFLAKTREGIKEEWANSAFVGAEKEETLQRNAAALGQVRILEDLINATFEEIEEFLSE